MINIFGDYRQIVANSRRKNYFLKNQRFDHYFRRFVPIFGENLALFLKPNVKIHILHLFGSIWVGNGNCFANFYQFFEKSIKWISCFKCIEPDNGLQNRITFWDSSCPKDMITAAVSSAEDPGSNPINFGILATPRGCFKIQWSFFDWKQSSVLDKCEPLS
jgi:hypothetical protein